MTTLLETLARATEMSTTNCDLYYFYVVVIPAGKAYCPHIQNYDDI